MMKRIAAIAATVLGTLVGVFLLYQFREALILFLLSLAMAASARPMVDWIAGKRLPRSLGLITVYLSVIVILGVVISFSSGAIVSEITSLSDHFASWYEHIWAVWPSGTAIEQNIIKYLPQPPELYKAIAGTQGEVIGRTVLGVTVSSLTITSQFIAILVLSIYWSIDQVHFERLWLSLLPAETRARAREIWRDIETGVGAYIRSELTQSFLAGILLGVGFGYIGLPFPVLLAIFAAIAWLIPWLGALIALVPIIWAGIFIGPGMVAIAVVYTILVFLFLELVIEPRFYTRRKYSSLLTVLFVVALADAFGLVGILIAPPLAAATQILYNNLSRAAVAPSKQNDSSQELADLEVRLHTVRELVGNLPEEETQPTTNLVNRLDGLIQEASKVMTEEG